jgi:UDP-N-acetylmuramoyl-tripeptide--D-alanyl-D-alanine ligase
MIPLTARQIAEAVDARQVHGSNEATAGAVTIDSRRVGPGDCFFAIVGERHDGHEFAAAAIDAGAGMVVVERVPDAVGETHAHATMLEVADTTLALQSLGSWLRHELDPTVVAITGSLGKTTTKELAAALLGLRYSVHATPGNLNNHWGLPLSLLGLEPHHDVMVAEIAMSNAGEIRALARIASPDVGVVTNVAPAHMENFADLDVAAAKGELVEELPRSGTLIVNADDPRASGMPGELAPHISRVVRFGRDETADLRAVDVTPDALGWSFELRVDDGVWPIELQLPGEAGIASFLAAAATAWAIGVSPDAIATHAPLLEPLPNRGSVRRVNDVTLLDESYNASPVAVKAALDTLAALPTEGRHIAVLGDMLEMGAWTGQVHREVGAHAIDSGVDLLLAVGAFANLIAEGAADAGIDRDAMLEFETADEAATWLAPQLQNGDAVLVKGSRAVHLEHVVNAVTAASVVSNGAGDS